MATALEAVRTAMELNGGHMTPYEIQNSVSLIFKEWYSDSCITARIRDLRKDMYGGHTVNCRKREGSRAHEYKLITTKEADA